MPNNKPTWDYTEHAAHYDRRADYSLQALKRLYSIMGLIAGDNIADLGAGTGKLSVPLAQSGYSVFASEPNDAMRSFGISNTHSMNVKWYNGTGERSKLADHSVKAVTFGSSFNVVNQTLAIKEAERICIPGGWIACMWNHRDLDDPVQKSIEDIIKRHVVDYNYGSRRESPKPILKKSGRFKEVMSIEERFLVTMKRDAIVDAWRSHATLSRQAGNSFEKIISEIDANLQNQSEFQVPYHTRIWTAQFKGC